MLPISLGQKSLILKTGSNFLQNVGKIYQTTSQKIVIFKSVSWGQVAQDIAGAVINIIINLWFRKRHAFFLTCWPIISFSSRTLCHLVPFSTWLSFSCKIQCCCEIPHLYGSITMTGEDKPARSRSHATGTLTFMDTKWSYGSTINSFNHTYPARQQIMWFSYYFNSSNRRSL